MTNTMLASDVNNPEFVGAVNPDSLLHVEFYMHSPLDQHKSQQAGKRVYLTRHTVDEHGVSKDTGEVLNLPYIRIQRPGDNTTIIERIVVESDKARWPNQWMYFAHTEGLIDQGIEFPGYKIEDWPHINQDTETLRNLKYQRFFTVEQIAGASDAQIQRLGMGGLGLRKAAQDALRAKMHSGINDELAAKDKQLKEQAAAIQKLTEAVQALQNQKPAEQPAQPEVRVKRKYTRRQPQQASG